MLNTLRFMSTMILGLNDKRRSEEGATAVEYGLLVALIAAIIIGAVVTLGGYLNDAFGDVNGELAPEVDGG
jgi:pilus assembly protein Flp/PilA